jgi:hypothetical protein
LEIRLVLPGSRHRDGWQPPGHILATASLLTFQIAFSQTAASSPPKHTPSPQILPVGKTSSRNKHGISENLYLAVWDDGLHDWAHVAQRNPYSITRKKPSQAFRCRFLQFFSGQPYPAI